MALGHETVMFDVHDFRVYALLTDVAGASPTYATGVDVPGIAEVGLDPNLVTAELKGDARVIAKRGRIDRFNLSATYGKLDLDVLDVITPAVLTDVTSTRSTARIASPAPLPYFMAQFKIEDVDEGIGTLNVTLWKCLLTGGTMLGGSTDSFGQPTMDLESIAINGTLPAPGSETPLVDTGVMVDFDLFSTNVALRT